jgi:hypothetical protein
MEALADDLRARHELNLNVCDSDPPDEEMAAAG